MKKHEWFKEMKKEKEVKPMKFAKDALVLTAGVAVLAGGVHLIGELLD